MKTCTTKLKGWSTDISEVSDFNDLPVEARDYISFIEQEANIPVSWVGVGPDRASMILNPATIE